VADVAPSPGVPADDTVAARLRRVRERIRAAGGGDGVELVAVTKGFDHRAVVEARAVGVEQIGENYAQELLAKVEALAGTPAVQWHFIGRLQRNKVRRLAPHVSLWQTVDRAELGHEIARWAPGAAVLVQVDATGEVQKGGVPLADAPALVDELRELGLDVRGVMAVGPTGPPEAAREPFEQVVALADRLALRVRSIGMSSDLEVAVAAGSTMVRIGTDLFGPRPPRTTDGGR
jgi:pyridoxal phosphate enzyme (YggS family)